ncbi:unnamed protein product [Adineta ricciae]|uniref:Uncharacterized protein n=1 Tax=Adineta ricciae TaxID=249248 RepID=A0A815E4C6_ADIRI|nr:unnamed protein product [Adineta ricciae]
MATSRISINTNQSSNTREQRQAQARFRTLQRRTNALYDELSRSSVIAKTAVDDFKQAYVTITGEFQEQRQHLLEHLHHIQQDIKQSTNELNKIQKNIHPAQSQQQSKNLPKNSMNLDIQQMNDMVEDIDRVLNKIAQQLKPLRSIPLNDQTISGPPSSRFTKNSYKKTFALPSTSSPENETFSMHRLYTNDVDIAPQWVVASIDKRIFLCDTEGEVRIFSYSRNLRRQPLLIEHFHLATSRVISAFTVTEDYLVVYEPSTQTLTLHTHHGGILLRLPFPCDPIMMIRSSCHSKNQIWACSHTQRKCYRLPIDHSMKEVIVFDEYDLTNPISNAVPAPIGISTDDKDRIAVHDINTVTLDRLLLFVNDQVIAITLDFVKYLDSLETSRIEQVRLVPKHEHLIAIVYASKVSINELREVVIIDISLNPPEILYRLPEINGIRGIDITSNGELVYTVPTQKNKRIATKMHIYSLFR